MLSRRIMTGALAVAASALAVVAANPAGAVTPTAVWITAPGGTSSTTVTSLSLTGATTSVTLKDLNTGAPGTCPSASLKGSASTGSGKSPTNIAQINGSTSVFGGGTSNPCKVAGLPISVAGSGTWQISATAQSSPIPGSGSTALYPISGQTTAIRVSNITANVSSASCTFTVSGFADGTYTNSSSPTISLPATTSTTSGLTVSNVVLQGGASNCLAGAVNTTAGDKVSFASTFTISAATASQNPVWANAK